MNQERTLGLQWRLGIVYLAVSLLSAIAVVGVYFLAASMGMKPVTGMVAGAVAGAITGVVGSAVGILEARTIKLRLWEAGDMAMRIAGGDLTARVTVGQVDEMGLLEEQLNQMASHLETAVGEMQRLAEQNRRLAEEAGRGAALEERARLARDLHDTVNQQLFVLTLRSAAARRKLQQMGGEAGALAPELALLEEMARQAHGQARELIMQLRPTTLEQQGIGPALAEYVKAASLREGWELSDSIDLSIRLGGERGEGLFRVAQEALNNVSKHARARSLTVQLTQGPDSVRLRISDDGQGFDPRSARRPTAVGLMGMQERIAALGGKLKLESAPGQGTVVLVSMPLELEEEST